MGKLSPTRNRLAEILADRSDWTVPKLAEVCGIHRSRLYALKDNERELRVSELRSLALCLEVSEEEILQAQQEFIPTLQSDFSTELGGLVMDSYRCFLVAMNREARSWLIMGLQQQDFLVVSPESVSLFVKPGRTLLGRAVEQGDYASILANQRLSLVREDVELDHRVSRCHLDLTFCGKQPTASLFTHSSLEVVTSRKLRRLPEHTTLTLHSHDQLHFPNGAHLQVELIES